ncbi:SRPBCC domain-containing protein [Phyllobacterium sp. SB3]|uniref:SRPBCC family protein n=1 Tax=Phyllobacterium sp. SB3 TaxID=3156073 RepID=UPI0032AF4216
MSELELTINRTISASRERVFNAWINPAAMAKFMRPPDCIKDSRVKNDPVKGGRFEIVMVTQEREVPHYGTYLEIDPHSRLSFTWGSPHSLDDSVVTIDFVEVDPNKTNVTLRHVKFRDESSRDGHNQGWTAIISNLESVVA